MLGQVWARACGRRKGERALASAAHEGARRSARKRPRLVRDRDRQLSGYFPLPEHFADQLPQVAQHCWVRGGAAYGVEEPTVWWGGLEGAGALSGMGRAR